MSVPSCQISVFAEQVGASVIQAGFQPEIVSVVLPCTSFQESIISRGYTTPTVYRLIFAAQVDIGTLRRAWEIVTDRHDALRSRFVPVNDTNTLERSFAQIVLKTDSVVWRTDDQSDVSSIEIGGLNGPLWALKLISSFSDGVHQSLELEMHPALLDRNSVECLLSDVASAYNGLPLKTRMPFVESAEILNCRDQKASQATNFFVQQLDGYEYSQFPVLSTKTVTTSSISDFIDSHSSMSCSLTYESVCKSALALSISTSTFFQLAWSNLLVLLTGTDDVCFGVADINPKFSLNSPIGPAFYSYPVRMKTSRVTTSRARGQMIEGLKAEICKRYPVSVTDIMHARSQLNRDVNNQLYDSTVFVRYLKSQHSSELPWKEVEFEEYHAVPVVLEISIDKRSGTIFCSLSYTQNRIDINQATDILNLYSNMLQHVISSPDDLIFDFITSHVKEDFMSVSQPPPVKLTGMTYLHSDFERHARDTPQKVALEFMSESGVIERWTYSKLDRESNRLSRYLTTVAGVNIEDSVPLCMTKSPELYLSILAIVKSGAAFSPIDVLLPSGRISFMLSELACKVILVNNESEDRFTQVLSAMSDRIQIINVSNIQLESLDDRKVPEIWQDSITAYRIYTSGTTGTPKAVSVEVRNAVQTILASETLIPHHEQTRMLQYAAPTFDMSIYDCFIAWSYGLTLCAADQPFMTANLEHVINTMKVTLLDLTPSVTAMIRRENVPTVEQLYCIGEAMTQTVVNEWSGICLNSYGPTEAAMCVTIYNTSPVIKGSIIGKPFANTRFFVMDLETKKILPKYAVGELWIEGYQVAREYFRNQNLTQEKFVSVDGYDGKGYRTGDLVRMLNDGCLEFLGRKDDQVKLRGMRIEVQEINHVIKEAVSKYNMFKDVATIIAVPDDGQPQLVSFIGLSVLTTLSELSIIYSSETVIQEVIDGAREACQSFLPSYMIPTELIPITDIPLSSSGKLNRNLLQVLFKKYRAHIINRISEYAAKSQQTFTPLQATLRHIFANVSGVSIEQINLESTIYHLGMDSISATQVANAVRHQGLHCSAIDVLKALTIERLAANILKSIKVAGPTFDVKGIVGSFQNRNKSKILRELGISEDEISHVYPCSHTQEAILSQFQASEGNLYFNHMVYELPHDVNIASLRNGWEQMYRKYDILRSGFVDLDGKDGYSFAQIVHKDPILSWKDVTIDEGFNEYVEEEIHMLSKLALKNFEKPQIFIEVITSRSSLARYLLFAGSHATFDASTIRVLLDEVDDLVLRQSQPNSRESEYGPLLNEILSLSDRASVSSECKTFWKTMLQDATITRFPNVNTVYDSTPAFLSQECTSRLRVSELQKYCNAVGVSIQSVGLATWAKILQSYTGESDVIFGLVLSGQTMLENAEEFLFPSLITVPYRAIVQGTNIGFLNEVSKLSNDMLEFEYTPYRSIKEISGIEDAMFDTLFVYQKFISNSSKRSLFKCVKNTGSTEQVCSLELIPCSNDSLEISISYKTSVISSSQAAIILKQFESLMIQMVTRPELDVQSVDSISSDLLAITPANSETLDTGGPQLLHELVIQKVLLCPHSIAVEFVKNIEERLVEKQTWTYADLNDEANRIANYLLETIHDLKPDDIIATCFDKSPEASFAFYGIIKAGCAFLALDPSAPSDRKKFIVQDASVKCILVHDATAHLFNQINDIPLININSNDIKYFKNTEEPSLLTSVESNNLCYCLYTSGSTGIPKGCLLTHENAVQAMMAFNILFKDTYSSSSKFLQFASYHFDVSVLEQFWSWINGITMTSAPRDLLLQDLNLAINMLSITHLDLTPSLAVILEPELVPSLHRGVFITGGDLLKQEVLDKWGDKGVIYNAYGPTEVTIGCTMRQKAPKNIRHSNIGLQFENVGSIVLKLGTDIPALKGGIGELCVSGRLVGRGYINRDDLTLSKFQYNKYLNSRSYRTGDLVRLMSDLSFDFIGRKDTQIKLRGQRLEIGEIDSVIRESSTEVLDAVTLVSRHPKHQSDQLVSFVVTTYDHSTNGLIPPSLAVNSLLRRVADHCKSKLASYMVPTYILPIGSVPLSVNNKIEHKKLDLLYSDADITYLGKYSQVEQIEDWNGIELSLRSTIALFFGLDESHINLSTNVFELGIDSISAVSLLKLLRTRYASMTLSTLMKYPTISEMAAHVYSDPIQQKQQFATNNLLNYQDVAYQELDVSPDDIEYIIPCTPLQEGIIASALKTNNDTVYFNKYYFEIYDEVDTERLRLCWNSLVRDNQSLRACFLSTESGIVQVILRQWTPYWLETDENSEEMYSQCSNLIKDHWKNVKLSRPPIIFNLIKLKDKKVLFMGIHHAIYDANSLLMMFDDIAKYYFATAVPRRSSYVEAVYSVLTNSLERSKEFFISSLGSLKFNLSPHLEFSIRNNNVLSNRSQISFEQLQKSARALQCTTQVVLEMAFSLALSRIMGNTVVFGIVLSGRSGKDELEDVMGPFFNTLPVGVQLDSFNDLDSLAHYFQNISSSLFEYQHTPLRSVNKWLNVPTNYNLFQALLVYQNPYGRQESDILWKSVRSEGVNGNYPLALEIERSENHLDFTLAHITTFLDVESAKSFLISFDKSLRDILINSGIPKVENSSIATSIITEDSLQGFEELDADSLSEREQTKLDIVCSSIASVSGLTKEEIDPQRSIFYYGLDSIDAIRLSSVLRQKNMIISLSDIMSNPSAYRMAKLKAISDDDSASQIELSAKSRIQSRDNLLDETLEDIYYCTPLQDGILAESYFSKGGLYVNQDVLILKDGVDIEALHSSFEAVCTRNRILRSKFLALDLDNAPSYFGMAVIRVSHFVLPWNMEEVEEKSFQSKVDEYLCRPLSMNKVMQSPIFVKVIVSTKRKALILTMSHALYDGHSIRLIIEDIQTHYTHGVAPERPDFVPFVSKILHKSKNWLNLISWTKVLESYHSTLFPTLSSGLNKDDIVHTTELLSSISTKTLSNFVRQTDSTFQSVGLICWAILLSLYTGQSDVVFGTVLSGRSTDLERETMFPTMVTIPFAMTITGTFINMLQEAQEYINSSRDRQYTPLTDIHRKVSKGKRLFDTLFIYQKSEIALDELWTSVDVKSSVEYSVAVELVNENNNIKWVIAAKDSKVSSTEASTIVSQLDMIMSKMIYTPKSSCYFNESLKLSSILTTSEKVNATIIVNDNLSVVPRGTLGKLCYVDDINIFLNSTSEERRQMALIANKACRILSDDTFKYYETLNEDEASHSTEPDTFSPWTDDEIQICEVISKVSGINRDKIERDQSIFHLGLDSISGIRVSSLLRQRGIFLSVNDIISSESISRIAKSIANSTIDTADKSLDQIDLAKLCTQVDISSYGIPEDSIEEVLPASSLQIYMISGWQTSAKNLFVSTFSYCIKNGDMTKFEEAWELLVKKNKILRTTFVATKNKSVPLIQVILKSIQSFSSDDRFDREKNTKFELVPIRMHACSEGDDIVFYFTIHHALYDAWSLRALTQQLSDLYNGIEPPPNDSSAFESILRYTYISESPSDVESFWKQKLSGHKASNSHILSLGPRKSLFMKNCLKNSRKLLEKSRNIGISSSAILLAAYAVVYRRTILSTTSESVVFGLYNSGRTNSITGISESVYPILNVLPFPVKLKHSLWATAIGIQQTLIEFTDPKKSQFGLWRVKDLSLLNIDCSVNILEGVGDASAKVGSFEYRAAFGGSSAISDVFTKLVDSNLAKSHINVNFDVEFAFRDGMLDIGVFAAESRLRGFNCDSIVRELVHELTIAIQ
ncbi:hypothetical protein V1511DRAFT_511609 [Dipodascopsis uninucleata]